MKICNHKFYDNNNDEYPCSYPTYGYSDFCIFHDRHVNEKRKRFYRELEKLMDEWEKDASILFYDFKGFVFPKFDFKARKFLLPVDFRQAHFTGRATFDGCEFKRDVNFLRAQFDDKAIFQGVNFWGKTTFMGVKFLSKAIFIGGMFYSKVVFHGCKFIDVAVFKGKSFKKDAIFQTNTFIKDADFGDCKFYEKVDLSKTWFKQKLNLTNASFLGEIKAYGIQVANLKKFDLPFTSFDGAVLESANFLQMQELKNLSFKNSFLISCNFSNKNIINCNFTGAVLKANHTKGWSLDELTIHNTKFVYTNYTVIIDKTGNDERKIYKVDKESRVPAEGLFGDASNPEFTLKTYLKEPYKWDYLLEFPPEIRTGLLNYLNFFKDYVKATENIDVDIATQPEGQKLRVVFLVDDEEKMKHIQHILTNYIINIFKPFDNLEVEFRNTSITEFDKERLLVNYQNELLTTQTRLKYGLSNIDDREQTLNNLASFIPQSTIDNKKLFEVLGNAVSGLVDTSKTLALKQPIAEARAVSETKASINIAIENKFELNLSLAKLRDYLNELGKEENSISNQIEIVKDELETLQKDFQKNPSKEKLSTRFKPIYESIKGFSKFGIQNIDKIVKLCEYIGELVK